jgi:hypothetical protein
MSEGIPFRSRHSLQWQIVLVNPALLRAAQRALRATGPSHAIEEALRLVISGRSSRQHRRTQTPALH